MARSCIDSPPRGRGRPLRHPQPRGGSRLTPAWAGKTEPVDVPVLAVATHPRVGGEDVPVGWSQVTTIDSPPRGRGRRAGRVRESLQQRLTPAWAGKTMRVKRLRVMATTHPRVGGEDPPSSSSPVAATDSPPRGRGRRPPGRPDRLQVRLTPAWAGKTRGGPTIPAVCSTHPRVGGEDHKAKTGGDADDDSPPRGRGRHGAPDRPDAGRRLTPAWAGKTLREVWVCSRSFRFLLSRCAVSLRVAGLPFRSVLVVPSRMSES